MSKRMSLIILAAASFSYLSCMEQKTIDNAYIEKTMQEAKTLIDAMLNNLPTMTPQDWAILMKNAGKLEAFLDNGLINDDKTNHYLKIGIKEMNNSFAKYIQHTNKEAILNMMSHMNTTVNNQYK